MKKLYLIIAFLVAFPSLVFGQVDFTKGNFTADNIKIGQELGVSEQLATLILPETGTKKVVVVNSDEAQRYFDLGYHLMTNLLGASFTPTTAYAERLSISVAANATTIYVSSVLDRDGIVLPLSATNKGYFTLEPGTSREESIVCTTASSTLNTLSGCTRGLAASGSDETGSSDRAYSHNAGSKIIMTDIAQFFGNFVDITNAQTIGGIKHFTNNPTTSTSTPTSENQIITKKYVDDSVIAGGVVGSEDLPGIWIGATQDDLTNGTATSTYSGTDYNLVLQSKYANATSSATTTIPITKSNGKLDQGFLDLSEDFTWTGEQDFSSSTVSGILDGFFGDGSDGDVAISTTTTLTEDVYYNNLTINASTTLDTDGFKIYVRDTLTFLEDGKIINNGGDGGDGTAGTSSGGATGTGGTGGVAGVAAHSSSTLPDVLPGKVGANGAKYSDAGINGTAGDSKDKAFVITSGASGGNGGTAGGAFNNPGIGGAGGSVSRSRSTGDTILEFPFNFIDAGELNIDIVYSAAGSGSGGSADGAANSGDPEGASGGGGGSGGNGGIVFIVARNIITSNGNIYIEATGGDGGDAGATKALAQASVGGSGGGGGGNGGTIIMVYITKTGTGTIEVSGGIGGSGALGVNASGPGGATNGENGGDGNDGEVIEIDL